LLAGAEFFLHAIDLDLVATGSAVSARAGCGKDAVCKADHNGKRGEGSDHGWFSVVADVSRMGCIVGLQCK
jgi:hypothetical protein